jgi:hypothetical protein
MDHSTLIHAFCDRGVNVLWLIGLLLIVAVLFGGGTRSGFAGDAMVQLLAVPVLLAGLWIAFDRLGNKWWLSAGGVACGVPVLLAVLQLTPVPASLFRHEVADLAWSLADTASPSGWGLISLAPHQTWAAIASFIAPLAIFNAVAHLDAQSRLRLSCLTLALGVGSLGLGFVQIAQGSSSVLRFFETTNNDDAVGFFANRNHFAALLYVTLILAGAWFAHSVKVTLRAGRLQGHSVLVLAGTSVLLVAILAGLVLARSRAGFLLAMAAIAGIAAMIAARTPGSDGGEAGRLTTWRVSAVLIGFAVLFALQFGLQRILTRFGADQLHDMRAAFTRTTLETAYQSLPFGTGLGSFVPVYASVEKVADVGVRFANRAHNDPAELLLETGIVGGVLMLVFVGWFLARTFPVWFRVSAGAEPLHVMLQRAATICVLLLLAHSLLDYPLRTSAMAVVFALCCGILVPLPVTQSREAAGAQVKRTKPQVGKVSDVPMARQPLAGETKPQVDRPAGGVSPAPQVVVPPTASESSAERSVGHKSGGQKWGGSTVQWPESWQKDIGRPPDKPKNS